MGRILKGTALVVALCAPLALTDCRKGNGGVNGQQSSGNGRPAVAVAVTSVSTSDLTTAVAVVGSLAPKFFADVKSEVTGTVRAVYVTQWVPVKKGAPLARLDTTETDAGLEALRAVVAQATVGETRARREYERAMQLKEYGLITSQALDDAKSALEAAEAATRSANAQVRTGDARLAKSSIAAPIDGVVADRNVNVGDRVENMGGNSPMFRIVDNRLLDLTVVVPSADLPGVRVGQRLEFTTDAVPGRTFAGKVMFINPALEESSRSAKIVAEVPNADGALRGGMFVRGRIITDVRRAVLQVPRAALLNWNVEQHTADVFVVCDDHVEKRPVRVGAVGTLTAEVSGSVAPGDPVVTRGAFALRHGDRVTVAAPGASAKS